MSHRHVYQPPLRKRKFHEHLFIPETYLPLHLEHARKTSRTEDSDGADAENGDDGDEYGSTQELASEDSSSVDESASEDQRLPLESKRESLSPIAKDVKIKLLSQDQIAQRQVAGLSLLGQLPPRPFPVASSEYERNHGRHVRRRAIAQLQELAPPLHTDPRRYLSVVEPSSKERHFRNMNALVHRFMAERDYIRASQAWGLLIRAMPFGTDVRQFGRWGIGAELLLYCPDKSARRNVSTRVPLPTASDDSSTTSTLPRSASPTSVSTSDDYTGDKAQLSGQTPDPSSSDSEASSSSSSSSSSQSISRTHSMREAATISSIDTQTEPPWLPESNLEAAKSYYQVLINKYEPRERNITPEQRAKMPNFYPALMSVWIYQIVQRSRKARWQQQQQRHHPEPAPGANNAGSRYRSRTTSSNEAQLAHSSRTRRTRRTSSSIDADADADANIEQRIRATELAGARSVAQSLDDVLEKPLYDGNALLLRLRAMVGQWVLDLLRPGAAARAEALVAREGGGGGGSARDKGEDEVFDGVADEVDEDDDGDGYSLALRQAKSAYRRARACEALHADAHMDE